MVKPIDEREEIIDVLASELYATSLREFTPLFPWVFVRVLPKEQITQGGIILPAHDQNKTVHEGIVLATWKPVSAEPLPRKDKAGHDWRSAVSTEYTAVQKESQLKAGDHVLFPHWAGLPIEGFSDKHYRVVREAGWHETEQGGIFAQVEYSNGSERPLDRLNVVLAEACETDIPSIAELAELINKEFLLVRRGGYSVTLSGR